MIQAKYNPRTGRTETKISEILFSEQLGLELIGVIFSAIEDGYTLSDLVNISSFVWESRDAIRDGNIIEALAHHLDNKSPQPQTEERRSVDRGGNLEKIPQDICVFLENGQSQEEAKKNARYQTITLKIKSLKTQNRASLFRGSEHTHRKGAQI